VKIVLKEVGRSWKGLKFFVSVGGNWLSRSKLVKVDLLTEEQGLNVAPPF